MKIKLAVMFGGRSVEHEISVISAIQAIHAVDKDKYDVIPIYITKNNEMYVGEHIGEIEAYKNINALIAESTRVNLVNDGDRTLIVRYPHKVFAKDVIDYIDVAFPIVHGTNVEDGTLQGLLELSDIPYTSSGVTGSAVGMDKIVMKAAFKGLGVPVLDSVYFEKNEYFLDKQAVISKIEDELAYPLIVKPANLGSSIGIGKAVDRDSLEQAILVAVNYDRRVLVERAVTDIMEINCAVLGMGSDAIASLCEQPVTAKDVLDFEDKYLRGPGSKGMKSLTRKIPAEISQEMEKQIKDLSLEIFKGLDMKGVVRIDYIIDQATGQLYANEANTIPGSFAFYLFEPMGIPYKKLIDRLIECALARHEEKERCNFAFDSEILAKIGKSAGSKGTK